MSELLCDIDPTRAVSVSGHRPYRLPGNGDPSAPEAQPLISALRRELIAAFDRGKTMVLQGCMAGFDVFAAEQVILLKSEYPHIQLISIAPYSVHFFSKEPCWTPEWISRAREVFRCHDFGISLAEHYRKGIYYDRNRALVDHSSALICYHDGSKGGTQYTVNQANKRGLIISNLYNKYLSR